MDSTLRASLVGCPLYWKLNVNSSGEYNQYNIIIQATHTPYAHTRTHIHTHNTKHTKCVEERRKKTNGVIKYLLQNKTETA